MICNTILEALGHTPIIRLNKIEETLPSVIEEIVAEKNAVMESILVQ